MGEWSGYCLPARGQSDPLLGLVHDSSSTLPQFPPPPPAELGHPAAPTWGGMEAGFSLRGPTYLLTLAQLTPKMAHALQHVHDPSQGNANPGSQPKCHLGLCCENVQGVLSSSRAVTICQKKKDTKKTNKQILKSTLSWMKLE